MNTRSPLWRTTNPFIPLLSFLFVFTTFSERKLFRLPCCILTLVRDRKICRSRTQSDCKILSIPPAHKQREKKHLLSTLPQGALTRLKRKILCLYGLHSSFADVYVEFCLFIGCVLVFFLSLSLFSKFVTYSTST